LACRLLALSHDAKARTLEATMRRARVRLVIATTCLCLSACAGSFDNLVSTNSEEKEQQTSRPAIQGDACAKLSELKIGMSSPQVLSACGQKPIRTSEVITRDGKKVIVLVYGNSTLHITDDKLVQIFETKKN